MKQLKLKTPNNQTKKAFTIIEVVLVLVLAIAGLIFLMVFIALPALQRNQRDTQRKNELSTFASVLQNYASNNRGEYPKSGPWIGRDMEPIVNFAKDYLNWPGGNIDPTNTNKEFIDPSTGKGYIIGIEAPYEAAYNVYKTSNYMVYAYGFRCQQPGETGYKAKNGSISVWQSLESGGVNCIDVR